MNVAHYKSNQRTNWQELLGLVRKKPESKSTNKNGGTYKVRKYKMSNTNFLNLQLNPIP
jgi:hypothetical protein